MKCDICPRHCNVERGEKTGFCGAPDAFRLARAALHYHEEPCISGKNGSGTVFFSGCNLRCVYCQNYELSHNCFGKEVSDERLMRIFDELILQGANNINLVNPTHYAERLADVLSRYKSKVPIVYNSSGYESVETLKKLEGLVDVYLPDFKYISGERAKKYSAAEDYFECASRAIAEMKRQRPIDVFDENGMMQKGVIIRHLILPKNTNQSKKILEYIRDNFGNQTYISVMSQYIPFGEAEKFAELTRKITAYEYEKVVTYADELGFENAFVQDLSSATQEYVPSFDFEGL